MMPLRARNKPPVAATRRAGARLAAVPLALALVIAASAGGCASLYSPEGEPIFEDDFGGSAIDPRTWQTEMAWGAFTTGELQRYDGGALSLADGELRITASEDSGDGRPYTSGVVASFERFEFTYGYVEIRARMPEGQGLWPAFWLASTDPTSGSEIDVVEFLGHEPQTVHLAMHYDDESGEHHEPQVTYVGEDFTAGWHTFAVDWSPEAVVWYVDGVERARQTVGVPAEPMYLIANLAVGGEWPGEPDETTRFPAIYAIDYIRVYER